MFEVDFCPFQIRLASKLNRFPESHPTQWRAGLFLRCTQKSLSKLNVTFAEYYPHPSLRDITTEEFLDTFAAQKYCSQRKTLQFLIQDHHYQYHLFEDKAPLPSFYNHHFGIPEESRESPASYPESVYKLKCDHHFKQLLECFDKKRPQTFLLRLDANGLFNETSYQEFRSYLNTFLKGSFSSIEYIEDPSESTDWSWVDLPTAQDFVQPKSPIPDYYIYKPNRDFLSELSWQPKKIIFSSYQGGPLGQWHAYQELMAFGDLSLPHGIITPSHEIDSLLNKPIFQLKNETPCLYQKQRLRLLTFAPHRPNIELMYKNLHQLPWRFLCTI